jgi:TolB-like protein
MYCHSGIIRLIRSMLRNNVSNEWATCQEFVQAAAHANDDNERITARKRCMTAPRDTESANTRLNSWKEIADFLDRDVRSVQRWERERGLPVHRIPGQKGGAVFAYKEELEAWLRSGKAAEPSNAAATNETESAAVADSSQSVSDEASGSAKNNPRVNRSFANITLGASLLIVMGLGTYFLLHRKTPAAKIAPAPNIHSIAVLPLRNLSGDPDQEYFADGFTEELVTDLAQIHSLKVISRTSIMIYKGSNKPLPQIARELNVDSILEGAVTRDGNRVRVTAQLIDASTDTHLWARTYDADLKDVLDIQNQVSRAIVDDVRVQLSPEEKERLASSPTVDPEAEDLYLRAKYEYAKLSPESLRKSLDLFQQAVKKDPSYAPAYVGIGQVEFGLIQLTAETPKEGIARAQAALEKALELDPHSGEAHGTLAFLVYQWNWDWPRAEREFQLALKEGATGLTESRYGWSLATRGRFAEAQRHVQAAVDQDPLNPGLRVTRMLALYLEHKYPEGKEALDGALSLNPNLLSAHVMRGVIAIVKHDCHEAASEADWTAGKFAAPVAKALHAYADACSGERNQSLQYLKEAAASKGPGYVSPYQLALGYALLNDKDAAISNLEKSAELHEGQILYLKYDPIFEEIRSDSRYIALEKKIGLAP